MVTSIISNRTEFSKIIQSCAHSFIDGKTYNFSFEELKQQKTLKQLGFIFGGLIKALAVFYSDIDGVDYDPDIIKELLYEAVGIDEILQLPTGKKIVRRKSLSKMTKQEASNFINSAVIWIDQNTDCILPIGLRYCWTAHITDQEIDEIMRYPMQERDDYYLSKIRQMNCLHCGSLGVEAHHIKKGWHGKGIKPPDYMAIPLCPKCHVPIAHQKGEETLLRSIKNVLNGLPIEVFCRLLYSRTYEHKN